jgi:hypothetical protein
MVVLAAMVYAGDIVLALPGDKLDAGKFTKLVNIPVADLAGFKHIERPRDWNVAGLKELFQLLGLEPGRGVVVTQGGQEADRAVQELAAAVLRRLDQIVVCQQRLQTGLTLWGRTLLTDAENRALRDALDSTKGFLESLQTYTSPGRMKNFRLEAAEVQATRPGLDLLAQYQAQQDLVDELTPLASYLSTAEALLPDGHPWLADAKAAREDCLARIADPAQRSVQGFRQALIEKMAKLKKEYIAAYLALHAKARLGVADDRRKAAILKDDRLARLQRLSNIIMMPDEKFRDFQERLLGLETCYQVTTSELETNPMCPHCGYRPDPKNPPKPATALLTGMDKELDAMDTGWTQLLLQDLEDPTAKEKVDLLQPDQRSVIDQFLKDRELPDVISSAFVAAMSDALSNLERVDITPEQIREALFPGGVASTVNELRRRFEEYLGNLSRGKDLTKIRIVLR